MREVEGEHREGWCPMIDAWPRHREDLTSDRCCCRGAVCSEKNQNSYDAMSLTHDVCTPLRRLSLRLAMKAEAGEGVGAVMVSNDLILDPFLRPRHQTPCWAK